VADDKHDDGKQRYEDDKKPDGHSSGVGASPDPTTAPTTPHPSSAIGVSSGPAEATATAGATVSTPEPAPAHPASPSPGPAATVETAAVAAPKSPAYEATGFAPSPGNHVACPGCNATNNVSKKQSLITKIEEAFERRCHECGVWLGFFAS